MDLSEDIHEDVDIIPEYVQEHVDDLPEDVHEDVDDLPEDIHEDVDDLPEDVHEDVDDVHVDGEGGEDVLLGGDGVLVVAPHHHLEKSSLHHVSTLSTKIHYPLSTKGW